MGKFSRRESWGYLEADRFIIAPNSRVQHLINLEPSSADGCGHGCGARLLVIDCSSSAGAEMRGLRMLQHQIHARYVDHERFGSDILSGARIHFCRNRSIWSLYLSL